MDLTLKDAIELAITFILGFVSGGVTFSIYKNKTSIRQNNNNVFGGDITGGDKNAK
ncbi:MULTISPECIES: hypothetical protein [Bacillus]|uniref:hypothetical protein n=1 Tax=Bacillus TaxID=1386 RepID=UPI000A5B986C|nr:hypothetical protein [Bacillus wiedmannii]